MKSLNLDPAVQVRYARKLIAENVSRRMGEPATAPQLPELLENLSPLVRESMAIEITKIAHTLATKGCDEAAIYIYDYLECAKSHTAEGIEQWKHLMKSGKHTGAQSVYKAIQKLLEKIDRDAYAAIYAASIELDKACQLQHEYLVIRTSTDMKLQQIRDRNKQTYPKSLTQRNAEKQEYLNALEEHSETLNAWANQIIKVLSNPM